MSGLPQHCQMQREICDERFNNVDLKLETISTQVEKIIVLLEGNGKKGMKTEIIELQQRQNFAFKLLGTFAAVIVGVVTHAVSQFFGYTK